MTTTRWITGGNARFCGDCLAQGAVGSFGPRCRHRNGVDPDQLCRRAPDVTVVAVDLAEHMLHLARTNVVRAGLQDRVKIEKIDAKAMPYPTGTFGTVLSNSIIHHIPDPRFVLSEMGRLTASGGLIFVRDLARPASDAEVDRLVALYGGEPPEIADHRASFENQRELFRASLKAALTVDEVAALAKETGIAPDSVRMTSDRHWTLAFRKP